MLQPQIVDKPAATYVGLEEPFICGTSPQANNFQVIGPLWHKFLHQVQQVPHRIGGQMFGVMTSLPADQRSHPDELQYLAAAAVSATDALPPGMISRTVPAATFAVFVHKGPIKSIGDTLRQIYQEWLPQSGYKHSGIADIELYDHRFRDDAPDSEMEYWISVSPKG